VESEKRIHMQQEHPEAKERVHEGSWFMRGMQEK